MFSIVLLSLLSTDRRFVSIADVKVYKILIPCDYVVKG